MFLHAIWFAYTVYTWVATENFKIWSAHIRASACVDILRGRSVGCSTPDLWRSTYRAVCTTKYVPCFKMSEIFLFRLYFECGHGNQTSGYSTDPLADLSVQFQPKNDHQNDHLKLLPCQSGSGGFSNMSYGCWFFNLQVASLLLYKLIYHNSPTHHGLIEWLNDWLTDWLCVWLSSNCHVRNSQQTHLTIGIGRRLGPPATILEDLDMLQC